MSIQTLGCMAGEAISDCKDSGAEMLSWNVTMDGYMVSVTAMRQDEEDGDG